MVLSTSWLTYTVIPIYAAMKAIDSRLFEAALDLGAGWFTTARRILLPLAAPGVFVAVILVYIPLFSEFATPALVGGRSGYMLGLAREQPDPGGGGLGRRRGAELPAAGRLRPRLHPRVLPVQAEPDRSIGLPMPEPTIADVTAREVLDCRGLPTVQVDVTLVRRHGRPRRRPLRALDRLERGVRAA